MVKYAVIIPTRNGGDLWRKSALAISEQNCKPSEVIVIDSSSYDHTVTVAAQESFLVSMIDPRDFNHGGTRNKAAEMVSSSDILIFITQDAVLQNADSLGNIISFFDQEPSVSAVCGRQMPHDDANPMAIHARLFNYPVSTRIKSKRDIDELGLKVAFMSNSFAAYRRDIFEKFGGFPENTILGEDMCLTAKMLLSGYNVAYSAEAIVYHSHNYTPWEEFRRYFDTGVFHACEPWIQEQLGGASGEGVRFVKSELRYLWQNAPLWIPRAILTTACKLLGYQLGKNYKQLPKALCHKLSMYKSYWLQQDK